MPLVPLTLDAIKTAIPTFAPAGCESRRILSFGYPDILASAEQVARIFGPEVAAKLSFRGDSASILKWHGASNVTDQVIDAASLFTALGFELEVMDLVAARGGEILQDLNVPIPEPLHNRYAMVLDAGTLEHCFNIAQAVVNMASVVAVGGLVMHGNPLNMYNHGFYNLNPTFYHDFYGDNGFAIERLQAVVDAVAVNPRVGELPAYGRFGGIPENTTMLVLARRKSLQALRHPVQMKYKNNPTLSG